MSARESAGLLDAHASEEEDKLVLLSALGRLGACSEDQLLRFAVETGLMDPFRFSLALAELCEAGFVRRVTRPEGALLVLTPEGRQSMELFASRIRASQQARLDENAASWRERVRRELELPADYERTEQGYVVTLRALEQGQTLFSMTLAAATSAQAARFCERWPECAPALYQAVMDALGEDAAPEPEDG